MLVGKLITQDLPSWRRQWLVPTNTDTYSRHSSAGSTFASTLLLGPTPGF